MQENFDLFFGLGIPGAGIIWELPDVVTHEALTIDTTALTIDSTLITIDRTIRL